MEINENWMTPPSGCHLRKNWQPDGMLIRLLIFFKWQPDGGVIRFSFPNQNDNRMKPIWFL